MRQFITRFSIDAPTKRNDHEASLLPETDSLYVEFKAKPGAETIEVTEGLSVDIDADGEVVGFDIDQASRRLDLSTLETEALPLHSIKAG